MIKVVNPQEGCERTQRAIDESLFKWPAACPALRASQCCSCQSFTFPMSQSCANCGGVNTEVVELPTRGRLWTWTVQTFMPKPPYSSDETVDSFRPYGVGYIEFPGLLKIEARLLENAPEKLRIGDEMEVIFYVHRVDSDGSQVINYAFKSASEEAQI